jgi:ribonuclease D
MSETDQTIDTPSKLSDLIARIAPGSLLALDTEFVREKTYYPKLCLIQLATPDITACIDCILLSDLAPLFELMFDSDCQWVFHSARQDLEVIFLHDERSSPELIDTQTAAALLGHPPQVGLQGLLAAELDVHLEKGHARTDWTRRPLPEAAVRYAFDDVRYLLPLWDKLRRQLEKLQRDTWFRSDCRTAIGLPPVTPPLALWTRLRGLRSLDLPQQCAALALVSWREQQAQSLDRPRRWILSDELLMRVAKSRPINLQALEDVPELPPRMAERFGQEIIDELEGCDTAEQRGLIEANLPLDRPDKKKLSELQLRVKERAVELGIESNVLATRKEIGDLLHGRISDRIGGGWRQGELANLLDDSR